MQEAENDQEKLKAAAGRIYHAWDKVLANRDVDGFLKFYAQNLEMARI